MRKPNQSFVLRISDSYIAIICQNYQEYSIFDPHARNSDGEIDGEGSAALFRFQNSAGLTNYLTRLAAGKNDQIDLYPVNIQVISADLQHLKHESMKVPPKLSLSRCRRVKPNYVSSPVII